MFLPSPHGTSGSARGGSPGAAPVRSGSDGGWTRAQQATTGLGLFRGRGGDSRQHQGRPGNWTRTRTLGLEAGGHWRVPHGAEAAFSQRVERRHGGTPPSRLAKWLRPALRKKWPRQLAGRPFQQRWTPPCYRPWSRPASVLRPDHSPTRMDHARLVTSTDVAQSRRHRTGRPHARS